MAGDEGEENGSSARTSRACRRCAAAKIRCNIRDGATADDACERCHRLGKECLAQEPAPPKKKRIKTTRVAQLEKKLDGLITMIGQQQTQHSQLTPETPPTTTPGSSTQENQYRGPSSAGSMRQEHTCQDEMALFERFRSHMAPHFPFVEIPDETLYQDVKRNSPFLFSVIILVSDYHNLNKQRMNQKAIIESLSRRVYVNNEKSMDLLQGILIMCAWYHPHMFECPQLSNLMLLAQAIATDLGLNRSPQLKPWTKVSNMGRKPGQHGSPQHRTMEERRALLGCYYLQAVVSRTFKTVDPPRFTSYMDDCFRTIAEAKEGTYDTVLVQMIQIQRIHEQIHQCLPDEVPDATMTDLRAPIAFHVRAVAASIQEVKDSVAVANSSLRTFLMLSLAGARVQLYEAATYYTLKTSPDSTNPTTLDYLYSCIRALESFYTTYLLEPLRNFFYFPLSYWALQGLLIVAVSKIYVADAERWNRAHLAIDFDPVGSMDQVLQGFKRARVEADVPDNDLFLTFEMRTRMFKGWIEAKQTSLGLRPTPVSGGPNPSMEATRADTLSATGAPVSMLPPQVGVATQPLPPQMQPNERPVDWAAYEGMWGGTGPGLFSNVDDLFWKPMGLDTFNGAWSTNYSIG